MTSGWFLGRGSGVCASGLDASGPGPLFQLAVVPCLFSL